MRAISAFRRDAGMSTRVPLAVTALRIRDSISAIGSVISLSAFESGNLVTQLPTTLRDTRDVAVKRELAETETAQGELAHVGARAPAQTAAVAQPDLELRRLRLFRDLCCCSH